MSSILIWQVLMLIIAMVMLAHFAQHGLGEMRRSIRQFTIFMLDKAPVGMVDLFSNKTGSASRNWMMFGAIWFTLAATIGFLKAWLLYDATALDSLASIGWEYNAETSHVFRVEI